MRTTTKRQKATVWILCWIILIPTALSLRCYSCNGNANVNCENTLTEIECQPFGSLVHDSCFTLSKVMKYPFIGTSYEQIKDCSVFAHCDFLQNILCDDPDGFLSNCSIDCCTGDLCNGNRTFVNATSTITNENVTSTIAEKIVTSTITDKNVAHTITDKNITRTRTNENVKSTIESVDVASKTRIANITSLLTRVRTTIIYMHASSTGTLRQSHIKSTITDETTSSRTVHTGITATRPYNKTTSTVRHENVTNTFTYLNATNTSAKKSSRTHVPWTVTRARQSGMQEISSTSWKESPNDTEAQTTLPIPDATRFAGSSSVTLTTTITSPVVDVYSAGAVRTSTPLTFVLFLVNVIVVMGTE